MIDAGKKFLDITLQDVRAVADKGSELLECLVTTLGYAIGVGFVN